MRTERSDGSLPPPGQMVAAWGPNPLSSGMLPDLPDIAAFRRLRRDPDLQHPAIVAIAQRHGLPVSELAPFAEGTHLVWGTGSAVIKVFVPLWPRDAEVEVAMLERLAGTGLPVPQLQARGEIGAYPYVVMSRLAGRRIGDVWPDLLPDERVSLATGMGEAMAALHALAPPALPGGATSQDALLAERLPRVLDDQRSRGADEALLARIGAFVDALGELPPAQPVLMHADLTDDHFLIRDGRITGVIDFADAFVGPWVYDLAAPAASTTRGDPAAQQAMLRGLGRASDRSVVRSVRAWVVLHRYVHLAAMIEQSACPDLARWLDTVWDDGGAQVRHRTVNVTSSTTGGKKPSPSG
jgi:hygromycin-B 7''-O-kinase